MLSKKRIESPTCKYTKIYNDEKRDFKKNNVIMEKKRIEQYYIENLLYQYSNIAFSVHVVMAIIP